MHSADHATPKFLKDMALYNSQTQDKVFDSSNPYQWQAFIETPAGQLESSTGCSGSLVLLSKHCDPQLRLDIEFLDAYKRPCTTDDTPCYFVKSDLAEVETFNILAAGFKPLTQPPVPQFLVTL